MTGMTWLAWLLPAVPLASGAGLAAAGTRVNRAAPAAGVLAAAVTLALACTAAAVRPAASVPLFAGIPAAVRVDGLSAVLVVTVAAVTLAVLVFSAGEPGAGENRGRFFGLMLLFAGAMLVTVTATTLALLLMGWEVMGAASWALIGYWWREPRRVTAANTAFLVTRGADLGLYVAAGAAVAGGAGSLALASLPDAAPPWLTVITIGVVLAAFGKSAQLPFSFWLSRAMEGPSAVSALLHSATMVAAGAYLLLRTRPCWRPPAGARPLSPGRAPRRPWPWAWWRSRRPTSNSCLPPRPAPRSGSWCWPPARAASRAGHCSWSRTPRSRACCSSPPGPGWPRSAPGSCRRCAARPANTRWWG